MIESNFKNKKNQVIKKFKEYNTKKANEENGIGNVEVFLKDLEGLLTDFKGEMEEEGKSFSKDKDNIELQLQNSLQNLKELNANSIGKVFRKSEINSLKEEITELINRKASCIHELYRREYGQKFFTGFIQNILDSQSAVDTIKQRLKIAKERAVSSANKLSNSIQEKQKIFVIDLHKEDLDNVYAKKDDYILADFVDTLNLHQGILDFDETSVDIINNYFWKYTKNLDKALEFRNKSIDEVLQDYKEDEKQEIARRLLDKSKSLWQKNTHGYSVNQKMFDYFVVGLPSLGSSFKNSFDGLIDAGKSNIEYVGAGVKNKVTCYKMEAAVPIFGVSGVKRYEEAYQIKNRNSNSLSYSTDREWETTMDRENFSIWPKLKEDNSLSVWVFGLIYGFIRLDKEKNVYEIKSREKGDPLDDYWYELDEYRDKSFDIFKKQGIVDEIEKFITEKEQQAGSENTKELITDVKKNYKDEYAQINIPSDQLKKREYKSIAELIRNEINFITKNL
jgi:hypothetical protein